MFVNKLSNESCKAQRRLSIYYEVIQLFEVENKVFPYRYFVALLPGTLSHVLSTIICMSVTLNCVRRR